MREIPARLAVEGQPAAHVEGSPAHSGERAGLGFVESKARPPIVRAARGHGERALQPPAEHPSRHVGHRQRPVVEPEGCREVTRLDTRDVQTLHTEAAGDDRPRERAGEREIDDRGPVHG